MGFRELEYHEIEDFIIPIKTTIDLNMKEYLNFFDGKDNNRYYRDLNRIVVRNISAILDDIGLNSNNKNYYCISYTPHRNGRYDFRMSPIVFINNVFMELGLDNRIPFIDLDDKYGLACFDDQVFRNVNEVLTKTNNDYIIGVLDDLVDNIQRINNLYYEKNDINDLLKNCALPKDILFTVSNKSLDDYVATHDEVYAILPYYYYHRVSDMKEFSFPHAIRELYGSHIWYDGFRNKYQTHIGENYTPRRGYELDNKNVIIGMDILKPGSIDRELNDIVARARAQANVDYGKYISLFEKKINFYRNSPYVRTVVGKYGLNGYMGFTYDNEYLVFDKFYNSDTIDPSRRTILTHGEAIYALPSDQFILVAQTKQDIIDAKRYDDRIKKLNHTESFIERVEPIIYGPNVSTSTFDYEIQKYQKQLMINKI